MSKELEALKILKANAILFDDGTDFGASMLEAINDLDTYLTQPSEEEVCVALSKYLKDNVYFKKGSFMYTDKYGDEYFYISLFYNTSTQKNELIFKCELPLDIHEMITKFYKGGIEMSKELEAFERVWEDCSQLDLGYISKHNLMDDLREIKKALTPPTADEVCEALSETILEGYGQVEWKYIDDDFVTTVNDDEHGIGVVYLSECKIFKFPPHLITLIGRFYESIGKIHEEVVE